MLEDIKKLENIELYAIVFLVLFTLWFIVNTVKYYKGEKRKIKHLHRFAKEGEVESQAKLADHYHEGNMVKKDCQKAVFWYQNAAFNGDEPSKNKLRTFLEQYKKNKKC